MNYLTSINLNKNELQNAVLHPLANAPANPKAGQIYYNTATKNVQYYDGTKWVVINDIDLSGYALKTDIKVDDVRLNGESVVSGKIANINLGYNVTLGGETGTLTTAQFNNLLIDNTSYLIHTVVDGAQIILIRSTASTTENVLVYTGFYNNVLYTARVLQNRTYTVGSTDVTEYSCTIDAAAGLTGTLTDEEYEKFAEHKINFVSVSNFEEYAGILSFVLIDSDEGGGYRYATIYENPAPSRKLLELSIQLDNTPGTWAITKTTLTPYHINGVDVNTGITETQFKYLLEDENSYVTTDDGIYYRYSIDGASISFQCTSNYSVKVIEFVEDGSASLYETVFEDKNNRVNSFATGSATQYPTTKAVADYVSGKISDVESKIKITDVRQNGTSVLANGVANIIAGYQLSISNIDNTITQEQYNALSSDSTSTILYQNTVFHKITNASGGMNYSAMLDGTLTHIAISNATRKPVMSQWVGETTSNKTDTIIPSTSTSYPSTKAVADYALPLTGGSITGDLTIGGNLTVNGTTTTIESTTLAVKDKLIEVAHGNTTKLTSPAGLFVPKYDGTNNGALVYDGDGTAYVGDVVLNSNGDIDVSAAGTKLVPLAGRAKTIVNGSILRWNSTDNILESAGFIGSDIVLITGTQVIGGNKLFTNAVTIAPSGNTDGVYTTYAQGQITFHNANGKNDIFNLPVSTNGGTKTLATTDDFAGYAKKFSKLFAGDGSKTSFAIEHDLGLECTASLYKVTNTTNPTYEMVMADITLAQTSGGGYTATVRFAQAPTTNDIFVLVITG